MSLPTTSYDAVPYISEAFPEAHPRRLEAVAWVFGLESPEIERCRVLEMGCADGGNLLPMACELPEAQLVGIDLSTRQIEDAKRAAEAAGVSNIDFRAMSITEIGEDLGQFDYIICHGVFSWVPREVQEAIFEVCRRNLAPTGVAYISYNTYPGWHVRDWSRQAMCWHAGNCGAEEDLAAESLGFLKVLSESPLFRGTSAQAAVKSELEHLTGKPTWYVLHEQLDAHNQPLYFREFMERAMQRGLQYLGDARGNGTIAEEGVPGAGAILQRFGGDILRQEQYADFIRNQMFRRTLLCRDSAKLDRTGGAERIKRMWVASGMRPERVNGGAGSPIRFVHPRGPFVTSSHPTVNAALSMLYSALPQAMKVEELAAKAQEGLKLEAGVAAVQREELAKEMLRYWMLNLLELCVTPPQFAAEAGQRPAVSAVARQQARHGRRVANLRHEMTNLDDAYRSIVASMDGTHTAEELAQRLIDEGLTGMVMGGMPADMHRQMALEQVRQALKRLAKQAMLVA